MDCLGQTVIMPAIGRGVACYARGSSTLDPYLAGFTNSLGAVH